MSADIAALAAKLDDAARFAKATPQIAGEPISVGDAYAVQKTSIQKRLARGERIVGMKMGFTSRAKMIQMNVSDLICGRLTDAMMAEDGGAISFKKFVHPRVEPEVAFLLRKPLIGKVTPLQALDAVEAIAPALEIIDSRYENFKFSLTDVIADNSSSSAFVIGPWRKPDIDIANLGMVMSINGRPQAFGSTAAILGHPLRSLVSAARLAAEFDVDMSAGNIVMAGGATAASALSAHIYVSLEVEALGRCGFSVED
ncbi:MAG: fumarylacetoacetate hydrolase family protein [Rhodospirillaceae bacterium]|nr:fumarylacetoacetate hydrolase family protein [Rhodospirillaceae bacterium]